MFDAPGELGARPEQMLPAFARAQAGVRVRFSRAGGRTVRSHGAEWGGFRARFPDRFGAACECVLVNTGGGMAGGDSYEGDFALDAGADAVVTTQAAEKIYRSQGPATRVSSRITMAAGSSLTWCPQEAILFARGSLSRTLDVEMAADARLIACESLYFGRAAMGESLDEASLRDRWRVRRDGRLIFAEDVRLEGAVAATLARPAIGGGARAAATVLMVAPDAAQRLDAAREAMAERPCEWGMSALDGMLIARLLSPDAAALRSALAGLVTHLSGRALPRSWQT